MMFPEEIGIIVLPDVVLFPQSLLPLHVFEPHYRSLVMESLESHRMLAVSMESVCGCPTEVAGLGIIRMCSRERDGSFSLMLQGVKRIRFTKFTQKKPYFVGQYELIEPVQTSQKDTLLLMKDILKHVNCPEEFLGDIGEIEMFLKNIRNYDMFVDLLASSLVTDPQRQQKLMETDSTKNRLTQLAQWLSEEKSK